jgi:FtsH-binding integral membrane protein
LEAALLAASMTLAITFYAFTTENDFTLCGPILYIFGFVMMTASLISYAIGFHN